MTCASVVRGLWFHRHTSSRLPLRPFAMHPRFLLAAAVLATCAHAQDPPASAPAPQAPAVARKIILNAGHPAYPAELAASGVQGSAEVLVELGPEGKPAQASIRASSRSQPLDDAALAFARTLSFKAAEGSARGPFSAVVVPVEFAKDSAATLGQKSCGDLNVDLKYFTATFPDKKPDELKTLILATGLLVVSAMAGSSSKEKQMAFFRSLKPAIAATLDTCARQPDLKFLDVMKQSLSDAMAAPAPKSGG
jgi:protein TonB